MVTVKFKKAVHYVFKSINITASIIGVVMGFWILSKLAIEYGANHPIRSQPAVSAKNSKLLIEHFDELLQNAQENTGLDYVAMITKNGQPDWIKQNGSADGDTALSADTPMAIGSISKQFLATAIMKLSEDGRIDISKPLCHYLKELCETNAGSIDLRSIMNHTSGLPRDSFRDSLPTILVELSRSFKGSLVEPQTLIEYAKKLKLNDAPGTKYEYSNFGYELLSLVLVQVTGMDFSSAMETYVFKPAGLLNTFIPSKNNHIRFAKMYRRYPIPFTSIFIRDTFTQPLPFMHQRIENLLGAGAVVTTAKDLTKWGQVANQQQFLKPSSWKEMQTPGLDEYGFGWVIEKSLDEETLIWHNGQWIANFAIIYRWPTQNMTAVFITNNQIDLTLDLKKFKKNLHLFLANKEYSIFDNN